jgi:hypothetical protein
MKDKARGDEKKLQSFVVGLEIVKGKQSLVGFHFDQAKDFLKVRIRDIDLIIRVLSFPLLGLCCYAIISSKFEKIIR